MLIHKFGDPVAGVEKFVEIGVFRMMVPGVLLHRTIGTGSLGRICQYCGNDIGNSQNLSANFSMKLAEQDL
jgi:hypothetical protein